MHKRWARPAWPSMCSAKGGGPGQFPWLQCHECCRQIHEADPVYMQLDRAHCSELCRGICPDTDPLPLSAVEHLAGLITEPPTLLQTLKGAASLTSCSSARALHCGGAKAHLEGVAAPAPAPRELQNESGRAAVSARGPSSAAATLRAVAARLATRAPQRLRAAPAALARRLAWPRLLLPSSWWRRGGGPGAQHAVLSAEYLAKGGGAEPGGLSSSLSEASTAASPSSGGGGGGSSGALGLGGCGGGRGAAEVELLPAAPAALAGPGAALALRRCWPWALALALLWCRGPLGAAALRPRLLAAVLRG